MKYVRRLKACLKIFLMDYACINIYSLLTMYYHPKTPNIVKKKLQISYGT